METMKKMETYSFQCECGHVLTVSAENRDEAGEKLLAAGRKHITKVHPDMTISDEDLKYLVRSDVLQGNNAAS